MMTPVIMYAYAFMVGAVFGSFLNVCIYRIPKGQSLIRPASQCPYCHTKIKFYHNIPLLSYLFLKGKCAYCGHKIASRYFWVELCTALLTVLTYSKFGLSWQMAFNLILLYALIVTAFVDYAEQIIPNKVLLTVLIAGLLLNVSFRVFPWKEAFLGLLVSGVVFLVVALVGTRVFKKESMGMGDVKLAAVLGFFLGWQMALLSLYIGFVLALLFFISLKFIDKQPKNNYIPMAPFFSIGVVILIFWGQSLNTLYWKLVL